MNKVIGIITSDPESINYEIIKKSLFFFKKKNIKNKYLFIGSKKLFCKNVSKKLKHNMKILNVKYRNDHQYLKESFEKAFFLLKKKKVDAIINLPLNKKKILKNKFPGITEYISDAFNCNGNETMLLYNKNFSVSPLTTHIKINEIAKKITKKKLVTNINNINNFYQKILNKKKTSIGVLGLNPHNGIDFNKNNEEEKIIKPTINKIKNKKLKLFGPISPDSSFLIRKKKRIDVLIGLYHDQILTTFKYINKFSAINITLGLPFLRISPDHGTGNDIIGKNRANPQSFLNCLRFFEKFHKFI